MHDITDKRVVVTGAGTGIGREIALEFARQGADVILHYVNETASVTEAADQIRGLGRRAEVIQADFASVAAVQEFGDKALAAFGGVDILVNNAGITFNRPFLEVTAQQFDQLWHVNMRAQFFLTQGMVQDMLRRGRGAICNLASIHGIAGAPEHSVYAATKGAVIAFTRALAVELAHQGIRVNAVAPGAVVVENYHKAIPGFNEVDERKFAADKIPLGRSGAKGEIAKLVVFLCSDAAGYIVGQTIVADGGTSALMSLISDFRTRSEARFGRGYIPEVA